MQKDVIPTGLNWPSNIHLKPTSQSQRDGTLLNRKARRGETLVTTKPTKRNQTPEG